MAARGRSVTVTVPSPLGRDELPGLFARTCDALARERCCQELVCEVSGVTADAVALEALARLALAARRAGVRVRVRGYSRELRELVVLAGLADVLDVRGGRPA